LVEPIEQRVIRLLGTQLAQAQVDNAFLVARLQMAAELVQAVAMSGEDAVLAQLQKLLL